MTDPRETKLLATVGLLAVVLVVLIVADAADVAGPRGARTAGVFPFLHVNIIAHFFNHLYVETRNDPIT